jgi:hypothetical protein
MPGAGDLRDLTFVASKVGKQLNTVVSKKSKLTSNVYGGINYVRKLSFQALYDLSRN